MPRIEPATRPLSSPRENTPGAKEARRAPTFSTDRKGESSAGALSDKDKKRAVAASSDGSNKR